MSSQTLTEEQKQAIREECEALAEHFTDSISRILEELEAQLASEATDE